MRVHTLFTFDRDGEDPISLTQSNIDQFHSFIVSHRRPDEIHEVPVAKMTDEQRAHPHYRGIRAIGRLRSGAFMRQDVDDFFVYIDTLIGRARVQIRELVIERDRIAVNEPSQKAYNGLISGITDSVERIYRLRQDFAADIYPAMNHATPSHEHP